MDRRQETRDELETFDGLARAIRLIWLICKCISGEFFVPFRSAFVYFKMRESVVRNEKERELRIDIMERAIKSNLRCEQKKLCYYHRMI